MNDSERILNDLIAGESQGTEPTSRELLHLIRQGLGLTNAAYLAVQVPPLTRKGIYGEVTYSDAWVRRYIERKYVEIDPVLPSAQASLLPIDWSKIERKSIEVRAFFEEAIAYGVGRQGLTIPIRGTAGERAFFSVTLDVDDEEWRLFKRERMTLLQTVAHYYHDRVLATHGINFPDIRLTDRQKQILTWAAAGHGVNEIGKILFLSPHTVQRHLEIIRARLHALNTTHAVARALKFRIIDPPE